MKTAKIENWAVVSGETNPYQAPESISRHIRGEVYGHPNFPDGDTVTTSTLVLLEGGIAKTQNTQYSLGHPEEKYTAWCIVNGYNIWTGSSGSCKPPRM
tara:strand:+ start:939 stop:1235 length:297 start_codon:yes stop_codon:yes gene_type:complete